MAEKTAKKHWNPTPLLLSIPLAVSLGLVTSQLPVSQTIESGLNPAIGLSDSEQSSFVVSNAHGPIISANPGTANRLKPLPGDVPYTESVSFGIPEHRKPISIVGGFSGRDPYIVSGYEAIPVHFNKISLIHGDNDKPYSYLLGNNVHIPVFYMPNQTRNEVVLTPDELRREVESGQITAGSLAFDNGKFYAFFPVGLHVDTSSIYVPRIDFQKSKTGLVVLERAAPRPWDATKYSAMAIKLNSEPMKPGSSYFMSPEFSTAFRVSKTDENSVEFAIPSYEWYDGMRRGLESNVEKGDVLIGIGTDGYHIAVINEISKKKSGAELQNMGYVGVNPRDSYVVVTATTKPEDYDSKTTAGVLGAVALASVFAGIEDNESSEMFDSTAHHFQYAGGGDSSSSGHDEILEKVRKMAAGAAKAIYESQEKRNPMPVTDYANQWGWNNTAHVPNSYLQPTPYADISFNASGPPIHMPIQQAAPKVWTGRLIQSNLPSAITGRRVYSGKLL